MKVATTSARAYEFACHSSACRPPTSGGTGGSGGGGKAGKGSGHGFSDLVDENGKRTNSDKIASLSVHYYQQYSVQGKQRHARLMAQARKAPTKANEKARRYARAHKANQEYAKANPEIAKAAKAMAMRNVSQNLQRSIDAKNANTKSTEKYVED